MNENNVFVNSLRNMGFSERQAKVYSALLKKKDASLTDLQKISGVPQNKVSEVVNYLLREGYCSSKKIGNRKFFNIISPKSSLNRALVKMEDNLTESHKITNEMEEIFNNTDKIKEPFEYIEIFHGNDSIHQQFCQLVKNSKKEILGFTKPPLTCYTPDKRKEQEEVALDFIAREGILKSIYEIQDNGNDPPAFNIEEFETAGEKVKISESLPIKMIIFDRSALLIADEEPLTPSNEFRMTLIKQKAIVNAFCALFDYFWQKSYDVKSWKAVKYK